MMYRMNAQLGIVEPIRDRAQDQADEGEPFDQAVARIVKTLMGFHGVTPSELGEKTGISRSNVYRRLSGTSPWMAEELGRISVFFGEPVGVFYSQPAEVLTALRAAHLQRLPTGRDVLNGLVRDDLADRRDLKASRALRHTRRVG